MSACDLFCNLSENEVFENDHFTPLHLTEKKDFRFINFLPPSNLPSSPPILSPLTPPPHNSSAYLNPSYPLLPTSSLQIPSATFLSPSSLVFPPPASLQSPSSSSLPLSSHASPSFFASPVSSLIPPSSKLTSFDYDFDEDDLELGDDGQSVSTMETLQTKFLTDFRKIYQKKLDAFEFVKFRKEPLYYDHKFSGLVFGNIPYNKFIEHLTFIYKGLKYVGRYMDLPDIQDIENRKVYLPHANGRKKTLFLDLDETLVHTTPLDAPHQAEFTMNTKQGTKITKGINFRPYLIHFLRKVFNYYEIFIFSASGKNYATSIVSIFDPTGNFISNIFTSAQCIKTKAGHFTKDLRIFLNRSFKDMIIVDNLVHSFGFQLENGFPILEWKDDPNDKELVFLAEYLIEAHKAEDIRIFNKKKLGLIKLIEMNPKEIGLC